MIQNEGYSITKCIYSSLNPMIDCPNISTLNNISSVQVYTQRVRESALLALKIAKVMMVLSMLSVK